MKDISNNKNNFFVFLISYVVIFIITIICINVLFSYENIIKDNMILICLYLIYDTVVLKILIQKVKKINGVDFFIILTAINILLYNVVTVVFILDQLGGVLIFTALNIISAFVYPIIISIYYVLRKRKVIGWNHKWVGKKC